MPAHCQSLIALVPAIGQKVYIYVFGTEQKGVEAGIDQGLSPLFAGQHLDRLDHLYFPGFRPRAAAGSRGWHIVSYLCCSAKLLKITNLYELGPLFK